MRPVSAAWEPTIRGSHRMLVRATVCETFQTGVSPTGTEIPILAGSVTVDGTQAIRSTLDLTTAGTFDDGRRAWPKSGDQLLLAPYGNEIFVERGLFYSDDLVEYCPLGYFRIQTPDQDDSPDGPIRVVAQDRMAGIVEARLLQPVQFMAGTTLGVVVNTLITAIYPDAVIEWDDATNLLTLDRTVITEQDRYGFIDDLITSRGKVWYWDHRGVLTIKDLPDATTPVYTVDNGRDGVEVSVTRHITRDGVYNAVVATGEAGDTQTPVLGIALNLDPDSPTYYNGRFGKVPQFYSSPLLTTDGQALAAATTLLRKKLGLPYSVKFGTVANPALEPYDPIRVRQRDGAEMHVLQSLTIPLVEDTPMTAQTKEQTVVLIGQPT